MIFAQFTDRSSLRDIEMTLEPFGNDTLMVLRGSFPSDIVKTNGLVHASNVMPMMPV